MALFPITTLSAEENQVVFPKGSSFGLIPFEGATVADGFSGFIDPSDIRSVLIAESPLDSWNELYDGFRDKAKLQEQGIEVAVIEDIEIAGREALRVVAKQSFRGTLIPKCILLLKGQSRIAMFSAQMPGSTDPTENACDLINEPTERAPPTEADQLAALPFQLTELGVFRLVRVLSSSGVLLTRGPLEVVTDASQPVLIVASSLRPTAAGWDKQEFAVSLIRQLATYEIGTILTNQQLGNPERDIVELIAEATDSETGASVKIVQWLLVGDDGHYLRIIGIAADEDWPTALPQFTEIRDGLVWPTTMTTEPEKDSVGTGE